MRDKRLKLMWYCKTTTGPSKAIWRRFPAIVDGDVEVRGKVRIDRREARVGYVMDGGKLAHYPEGRFQIRGWENGKQVYQNIDAKDGISALVIWRSAQDKATKAAKLATGKATRLQTIKAAASAYVTDLENTRKMEAAENARLVLAEFEQSCHSLFVKMISRDCIIAFQKALRKRGLSERTIANKHQRVMSFLKWAKVDTSFVKKSDRPVYQKDADPTYYNEKEIDSIRKAANGDKFMRLFIDMALMLGLRDQELMYACWPDVDFQEATFRVQGKPELGFAVKNKKTRTLPIPAELLTRLQKWQDAHPKTRLILGTKHDTPNGHLLRFLKRLADEAGLNCGQCAGCREREKNGGKGGWATDVENKGTGKECSAWTLHKFRRTFATTMLRNGVDAKTVLKWMGHKHLDTTLRYLAAASNEEMQAKINSIW
jgi:integrase